MGREPHDDENGAIGGRFKWELPNPSAHSEWTLLFSSTGTLLLWVTASKLSARAGLRADDNERDRLRGILTGAGDGTRDAFPDVTGVLRSDLDVRRRPCRGPLMRIVLR